MTAVTRDELGLIWIGSAGVDARAPGIDALFHEVLIVPGGSVRIDVRRPRELSVVVDDTDAAGWWLEHLVGADAARAAFTLDTDDAPRSLDVGEVPGTALAASTSRLLELLWLQRWWPEPIEQEWLIDAEIGALAWQSEDLLGDLALASAVLRRDDVRLELTRFLARVASAGGSVDVAEHPVARTLHTAARAALDATDADAAHEGLRRAYAAVARIEDDLHAAVEELLASSTRELAATTSGMSLVAGGAESDADRPSARRIPIELDPRTVHPRSVDYASSGGVVDLEQTADGLFATVRLTVADATFHDPHDELVADVITDDEHHEVRLRRGSAGFVGTARLRSGGTPRVVVRSTRYDVSARPDLRDLKVDEVRAALDAYRESHRAESPHFAFELPPVFRD